MNQFDEFKSLKYGLMLHFGIYSMLGGVYKGRKGPTYAEWIECHQQIQRDEIEALARDFDPVDFDADVICQMAKDSGMKYIVITAKHHDGFALFESNVDSFNSYTFSKCKRDFIKELSISCKKYDLKLGLYYSQVIDWHEEHGGGYTIDPKGAAGVSWCNTWDYPDNSHKDYSICYRKKILPQIEELMTNYGEIFLIWFDMPLDSTLEQSEEIYQLVKKIQPKCLVNSRLGNGAYDYVSLGDNEIPKDNQKRTVSEMNAIDGFKPSPYGLYETAATINHSFGYSSLDKDFKTPEEIAKIRLHLESLGINYLLNVGPDGNGRIAPEVKHILFDAEKRYQRMK